MALLLLLLFPGLVWCLPGALAVRWAFPGATPLEKTVLSFLCGAVLIVPLGFSVSFLLRTPLTPWILVALALVVSGALVALSWRWPRSTRPTVATPPHAGWQSHGVRTAACTVLIAAAASLAESPRAIEATEVFAPCPHQSAFYLLEDGTRTGVELYDPRWERRVTHVLQHPQEPGYGMTKALTYQRVGSTATLVEPIAFFGSGGFVVASFAYWLLLAGGAMLLAAERLVSGPLCLLLTTAFLLGVRAIGCYMVNENVLALATGLGAMALVRRRPDALQAVFLGATLALCLATRPMAAGYLPALAWLMGRPRQAHLTALLSLSLFAVPWLIAHDQIFGQAVIDPSLLQARTDVTLFGQTFRFHPLGWPVLDTLVRGPTEPFPLLFQVPLEQLLAFGALFSALVVAGAVGLPWREGVPLLAVGLPAQALMCALVTLDHHKLSYGLVALVAVPSLAAAGASFVLSTQVSRVRRGVALVAALAVTVVFPVAVRGVELPVDPRPQYNDEIGRRDDPPIEAKRERLTHPGLLPEFTLDVGSSSLAFALLWNGRLAQRSLSEPVLSSPVFVWKQLRDVTHHHRVTLLDQPAVPPYLADVVESLELTDSTLAIALELPATAGAAADVTLTSDGHEVTVDVSAPVGPERRWLSLALIDDALENGVEVHLRINGREVDGRYIVLEARDKPALLRLVSNVSWRIVPEGHGLVFEPGDGAATRCARWSLGGLELGLGPHAVTIHDSNEPLRLRVVDRFPPEDEPQCEALELR